MDIKRLNSLNFSKKTRKNKDIKLIIIHYTGMQSKIASIKRLLSSKYKVSCHYLIDRQGKIFQMVDDNKVAWHAGKSKWKNLKNLNQNSIGIELVNKGHDFGYQKFSNFQITNLIKLCQNLKKKYNVKNSNILGHSDVAPMRKKDPGEKFPWKRLKDKKIGIWYKKTRVKKITEKDRMEQLFFSNLHKIGYRYFNKNKRSKKDIFIIKTFQRRFIPKNVTGMVDQKTFKISQYLTN